MYCSYSGIFKFSRRWNFEFPKRQTFTVPNDRTLKMSNFYVSNSRSFELSMFRIFYTFNSNFQAFSSFPNRGLLNFQMFNISGFWIISSWLSNFQMFGKSIFEYPKSPTFQRWDPKISKSSTLKTSKTTANVAKNLQKGRCSETIERAQKAWKCGERESLERERARCAVFLSRWWYSLCCSALLKALYINWYTEERARNCLVIVDYLVVDKLAMLDAIHRGPLFLWTRFEGLLRLERDAD